MHNEAEARAPRELVIAFLDLSTYTMDTRRTGDDARIADIVDRYYEKVAARVTSAGGRVVKFMGDGALAVFPTERADDAVVALSDAKHAIDGWLAQERWDSRLVVRAHVGVVVAGAYGGVGEKRFDVIGDAVNVTARLQTKSFAISAELFRKLSADTRKRFKKHTPPITYIPIGDRHPSNVTKWA